jgi:O-antigen ligase
MAALIGDMIKKMLIALLLTSVLAIVVPNLLRTGKTSVQSFGVIFFIVYTAVSLFTFSRHKLFFVLSVPVFTQFFHIFQRYDFPTGGNSIWRLFPFIILDIYLLHFLVNTARRNRHHSLLIVIWLLSSFLFLAISPNLSQIILGGIIMYVFTIPLLFTYLLTAAQATDFYTETEKYLSSLFVVLGLGTIGLIYLGAGYKGTDNLLATRNIADTNTTMAYFILLWPFVVLYAIRNHLSGLKKVVCIMLFLSIVILSFSRGALLIVLPYILITCLCKPAFINRKWFIAMGAAACICFQQIVRSIEKLDLLYFWSLRFADIGSISGLINNLEKLSGRSDIHDIAYHLFRQKPIAGHGIGSFEVLGPGYREAHSLWYTLLAEQGIIGAVMTYTLLGILLLTLIRNTVGVKGSSPVLLFSVIFFLIFNHSVGSTFIILTGNSISINCMAPMLLMTIYFYSKNQKVQEHSKITSS